jgi:hypothetical protein
LKLKTAGVLKTMFDSRVIAAYKLAGQMPSNSRYMLSHGNQPVAHLDLLFPIVLAFFWLVEDSRACFSTWNRV